MTGYSAIFAKMSTEIKTTLIRFVQSTVKDMHGEPIPRAYCGTIFLAFFHSESSSLSRFRNLLPNPDNGFDVVIMSDLLHFDSFHDILLDSVTCLLSKNPTAHLCVAVSRLVPGDHFESLTSPRLAIIRYHVFAIPSSRKQRVEVSPLKKSHPSQMNGSGSESWRSVVWMGRHYHLERQLADTGLVDGNWCNEMKSIGL